MGFGLLAFGSLLDLTDNFEELNRFVVIGDTDTQAVLEKLVGFLGGFACLAVGLLLWIPKGQSLSDVIDERTRELTDTNAILREEIEQRIRAERVKSDFVSTVNHELRTPSTSIYGSLRLLNGLLGEGFSDEATNLLQIAERNCDRLRALVDDLLDVQGLVTGDLEIDLKPVELRALVTHAIEQEAPFAELRGATIELTPVDQSAYVLADRQRAAQVISNLLSNAVKHTPTGERVEVTVESKPDAWRVAVRDRGPGIDPVFQPKVFERFTISDTSDTREKSGTGLGLYVSKSIVELHGGQIGFSTKPVRGSTFWFDLPAAEPPKLAPR